MQLTSVRFGRDVREKVIHGLIHRVRLSIPSKAIGWLVIQTFLRLITIVVQRIFGILALIMTIISKSYHETKEKRGEAKLN